MSFLRIIKNILLILQTESAHEGSISASLVEIISFNMEA